MGHSQRVRELRVGQRVYRDGHRELVGVIRRIYVRFRNGQRMKMCLVNTKKWGSSMVTDCEWPYDDCLPVD